MTEKEFATAVEDLLNLYSWTWCHYRPAKTDKGWRTPLSGHKGMPDYIAVKGKRLLMFELKSDTGKVSPEQQGWLDALGKTKVEVYCWRPDQFNEIVEILTR
ncbi:MAG: VRR-NUC domain-containing protein [Dehalococcoidales bacterium]|nr:VRR-NUC domain-containing protein [Dehalococcoidales bacterium]